MAAINIFFFTLNLFIFIFFIFSTVIKTNVNAAHVTVEQDVPIKVSDQSIKKKRIIIIMHNTPSGKRSPEKLKFSHDFLPPLKSHGEMQACDLIMCNH